VTLGKNGTDKNGTSNKGTNRRVEKSGTLILKFPKPQTPFPNLNPNLNTQPHPKP